jgi:multimeric flavodoxin WrbA
MNMAKKVLILKGSPRRNGNSSVLADQASLGARQCGADVQEILLDRLKIRPCNACDGCRSGDRNCVVKDDMQTVYPMLLDADAFIIASPIYYFTFSAQVKLCIDRFYALERPGGNLLKGKKVGILLSYGDSDLQTSGGINAVHTFESIFAYIGCEIAGVVHGTANEPGEIIKNIELLEKAFSLGKMVTT